mmetsp:Transcript_60556/g.131241  ORF Transcript_60556/g.131241 Transcript_60556/m.131241 type:complete len:104 (-) Transcript_60556:212-523(-)
MPGAGDRAFLRCCPVLALRELAFTSSDAQRRGVACSACSLSGENGVKASILRAFAGTAHTGMIRLVCQKLSAAKFRALSLPCSSGCSASELLEFVRRGQVSET